MPLPEMQELTEILTGDGHMGSDLLICALACLSGRSCATRSDMIREVRSRFVTAPEACA